MKSFSSDMPKKTNLHTFVICAYKESEFIEECVLSLKAQTIRSNIIMVTSTPSAFLEDIANRYDIPLFVNEGESGITQDWNFGLFCVKTKYATVAHQDDIYEPEYTRYLLSRMVQEKKPIIAFSDYGELRNGEKVLNNKMLKIKRLMLLPIKPYFTARSVFLRRFSLAFGDAICCPSVMFAMDNVSLPIFQNHFRSCEDWEAWEKLSKLKGSFLYVSEPLVYHRIHEDSETTKIIGDGKRSEENLVMFKKFWPDIVARWINKLYNSSEKSNKL